MTDTPLAQEATAPQASIHPTPCDIHSAILRAFIADHDNADTLQIPSHVSRLVSEAIATANREHGK